MSLATHGRPSFTLVPVIEPGGVVWRRGAKGSLKVLLVHRDRYDDWSLPGKLDPGETLVGRHRARSRRRACAPTGDGSPEVRYDDRKGRPSGRSLLDMEAVGGSFEPNAEVNEVRWLSPDKACATLSYVHDLTVLDGPGRAQLAS